MVSSISAHFVGDIDFDEAINSCIEDMGGLARASYILFYLFAIMGKFGLRIELRVIIEKEVILLY